MKTIFLKKFAMFKVIDVDMNLNPELIDQIPIQITSDSDAAGIKVDANETGENSGIFCCNNFFISKNNLQAETGCLHWQEKQ